MEYLDFPELLSSIAEAQRHINDRSTVYVVYGKSTTVIGPTIYMARGCAFQHNDSMEIQTISVPAAVQS